MDKVMFWKHEEPPAIEKGPELGLGKEHDPGLDFGEEEPGIGAGPTPPAFPPQAPGQPPLGPPEPAQPAESMMSHAPQQVQQPATVEKDFQLLSAKIDSLKAILDNINQRLENIERIAQKAQESERHETY